MKGFSAAQEKQPRTAEQKKATPEQEGLYNIVINQAKLALWDEKFAQKAAKTMKAAPNAVEGMARIGTAVMTRIYQTAKKAGMEIEPIVLIEAGRKVADEIGDMVKALGMKVSDEDVENAFYVGADMTKRALVDSGAFNQSDIDAEAEQVRQMVDPEEMAMHQARVEKARRGGRDSMGAAA